MGIEVLVLRKVSKERAEKLKSKIKREYSAVLKRAGARIECREDSKRGYYVKISYDQKIEEMDEIRDDEGGVRIVKRYESEEEHEDNYSDAA